MRKYSKRYYTPNTYSERVALENTRGRVYSIIEKNFSISNDFYKDEARFCFIPENCPRKDQIVRVASYYDLPYSEDYIVNNEMCFRIMFDEEPYFKRNNI